MVTKELTSQVLLSMLTSDELRVKEQGLMIYRNILDTEQEVQQVLDEGGEELLDQLEKNLSSPIAAINFHTLYILSNIAKGGIKQKKVAFDDRFFSKSL